MEGAVLFNFSRILSAWYHGYSVVFHWELWFPKGTLIRLHYSSLTVNLWEFKSLILTQSWQRHSGTQAPLYLVTMYCTKIRTMLSFKFRICKWPTHFRTILFSFFSHNHMRLVVRNTLFFFTSSLWVSVKVKCFLWLFAIWSLSRQENNNMEIDKKCWGEKRLSQK